MGVVLQVHPRKDRETETQQQGRPMAHQCIPETVGMGSVVASIVNHGALQMECQKACGQKHA